MQVPVSLLQVPTSEHRAPSEMQLAMELTVAPLHVKSLSSLSSSL
jgi:hypothetical protein